MTRWIDISVPLTPELTHWPGEPGFLRREHKPLPGRTSVLTMGSHTGTHIDAPSHFLEGAATADQAPLEVLNGPVRVVDHPRPEDIGAHQAEQWAVGRGSRVLIKTANSRRRWPHQRFDDRHVGLTRDAARWFAERRPALIGIDFLSIAAAGQSEDVHRLLLQAGIWILEGLDLAAVAPGAYELACLPLRVVGGDGAPARAVLKD